MTRTTALEELLTSYITPDTTVDVTQTAEVQPWNNAALLSVH